MTLRALLKSYLLLTPMCATLTSRRIVFGDLKCIACRAWAKQFFEICLKSLDEIHILPADAAPTNGSNQELDEAGVDSCKQSRKRMRKQRNPAALAFDYSEDGALEALRMRISGITNPRCRALYQAWEVRLSMTTACCSAIVSPQFFNATRAPIFYQGIAV